jgi:hypothetical protein
MTRWSTGFLILSLFALTCAAQDVPPPPKPADDGPSLADTMKFIEEKLGAIGRVNYVVYIHNDKLGTDGGTATVTFEATNVRASVVGCRIDYHEQQKWDDKVVSEGDEWFRLKAVEEVVVKTKEQHLKGLFSKLGEPQWTHRVDPPVFVLSIKVKAVECFLELYDESLAHRIAKALVHAVELCGGGSKDPF